MLFCKDIINKPLSQKILVLCPLVLTVQSILAAVYRIDLSGTPCPFLNKLCTGLRNGKSSSLKCLGRTLCGIDTLVYFLHKDMHHFGPHVQGLRNRIFF